MTATPTRRGGQGLTRIQADLLRRLSGRAVPYAKEWLSLKVLLRYGLVAQFPASSLSSGYHVTPSGAELLARGVVHVSRRSNVGGSSILTGSPRVVVFRNGQRVGEVERLRGGAGIAVGWMGILTSRLRAVFARRDQAVAWVAGQIEAPAPDTVGGAR